MNLQLEEKFWELPSVRFFIDRVLDSLHNRKTTVLILPPLVNQDVFYDRLANDIWKMEFSRHEITLENELVPLEPIEILNREFYPDQDLKFPKPLSEIQSTHTLPDVIVLQNLHKMPQDHVKKWLKTLSDWADLAHRNTNLGCRTTPILAIVPSSSAKNDLPPKSLLLDYFWWWGFPSSLEINLLCRSQNKYYRNEPLITWKEKLLSSLTPGDLDLIDKLWSRADGKFNDIVDAIRLYGLNRDIHPTDTELPQKLGRVTALASMFPGDAPPKKVIVPWSEGRVYATIEYGVELHPSELVKNNLDAIRHRLWRCQTELLLPAIDHLRVNICEDLTRKLGSDWPYRWGESVNPDEAHASRQNPSSTQLGFIVHLLTTNPNFFKYKEWLSIAKTARIFRNDLAHYKIIENFEKIIAFLTDANLANNRLENIH